MLRQEFCVAAGLKLRLGHLGRDMNLDVPTEPQAIGVFLCCDTNFDVATEVLHCELKLGHDLISCVATEAFQWRK